MYLNKSKNKKNQNVTENFEYKKKIKVLQLISFISL